MSEIQKPLPVFLKAIVLCLLLAWSGAAFAGAPHGGKEKKSGSKKEEKSSSKEEGGHGKSASESDATKNLYIKIPPLILPIIGDNGVEQIVSIIVLIEASSKDSSAEITDVVPRLNDAFVTELYGTLDRREKMKNGVIDVTYIKQRLTDITVKIVGENKVKNVLIQGVSQRQS